MIEIETRYGPFLAPDSENDLIGRFLVRYGEWARNEVRFVAAALPPTPVRILDLGAFIGTFGVGLSAERAIGSMVFVEANPKIASALRENVRRNAQSPSVVIEALVAPQGASLQGSADPGNLGSLTFTPKENEEERLVVQATDTVSLPQLWREHGPFDLIKMDVEGLEYAIATDGKALFGPGGPALWLECNPSETSLKLADLLLSCGMRVHYFAFPSFAADNFRGDAEPIFPFAFEAGLWASHDLAPAMPPALAAQGCLLQAIFEAEDLRRALWRTPRWGLKEWEGASIETMVAYAGHLFAEERYAGFLREDGPKRLNRVELEQAFFEALQEKDAELRAAYVVLEDERAALASARDRIHTHKAVTTVLETRIAVAQQQLAQAQEALHTLEASAIWRASRPVRSFAERHPRLRGLFRAGFRKGYKLCRAVCRTIRPVPR